MERSIEAYVANHSGIRGGARAAHHSGDLKRRPNDALPTIWTHRDAELRPTRPRLLRVFRRKWSARRRRAEIVMRSVSWVETVSSTVRVGRCFAARGEPGDVGHHH